MIPSANASSVTNFTISIRQSNLIQLQWGIPSDNGGLPVTSYIVQRASNRYEYTTIATVTTLYYNDTAITAGSIYYYIVRAQTSVGLGRVSEIVMGIAAEHPS